MDIIEIQKKKRTTELAIVELLNAFEEETRVKVHNVSFDRGIEMNNRGSFIYNVNLDIRL